MLGDTYKYSHVGIWSCRDKKYLKQYTDKYGNVYSRLNLYNKIYKYYIDDNLNPDSTRFLFFGD